MSPHITTVLFHSFLVILFAEIWIGPPLTPPCEGGQSQQRDEPSTRRSTEIANPYSRPKDIEQGALLVRARCSICHGLDATGGRGPDLTRGVFRYGNSDQALFRNIQNGIPGAGMPGARMSDDNIWRIINFIRFKTAPAKPPVLEGNAKEGEKIFVRHNCSSCHWTGKEGGRRGPDLSTSRSTLGYVKKALLDPNAVISPEYQRALIITNDGRVVEGMRLNENSYYIQLIDQRDQLWTIAKEHAQELHKPNQSLMPSYAKELTREQLDDLIAYLFSLRKE